MPAQNIVSAPPSPHLSGLFLDDIPGYEEVAEALRDLTPLVLVGHLDCDALSAIARRGVIVTARDVAEREVRTNRTEAVASTNVAKSSLETSVAVWLQHQEVSRLFEAADGLFSDGVRNGMDGLFGKQAQLVATLRNRVLDAINEPLLDGAEWIDDPDVVFSTVFERSVQTLCREAGLARFLRTPRMTGRIRAASAGLGRSEERNANAIRRSVMKRADIAGGGDVQADEERLLDVVDQEIALYAARERVKQSLRRDSESTAWRRQLIADLANLYPDDIGPRRGARAVALVIGDHVDEFVSHKKSAMERIAATVRLGSRRAQVMFDELGGPEFAATALAEFRSCRAMGSKNDLVRQAEGHAREVIRAHAYALGEADPWSPEGLAPRVAERSALGRLQVAAAHEHMRGEALSRAKRIVARYGEDFLEAINGAWELLVRRSAAQGGCFRGWSAYMRDREVRRSLHSAADELTTPLIMYDEIEALGFARNADRIRDSTAVEFPIHLVEAHVLRSAVVLSLRKQRASGEIGTALHDVAIYYVGRLYFGIERDQSLIELNVGGGRSLENDIAYEAYQLYQRLHPEVPALELDDEGRVSPGSRRHKWRWVATKLNPALERAYAEVRQGKVHRGKAQKGATPPGARRRSS